MLARCGIGIDPVELECVAGLFTGGRQLDRRILTGDRRNLGQVRASRGGWPRIAWGSLAGERAIVSQPLAP